MLQVGVKKVSYALYFEVIKFIFKTLLILFPLHFTQLQHVYMNDVESHLLIVYKKQKSP